MKRMKRTIAQFTFYDRTGIQNYLEKQAQNGWLLEHMGNFTWRFRRIPPQKIHFAVNYFPRASMYDPKPSEQQLDFQALCEHGGWKKAASSGPVLVFYNEAEDPVPVETDPVVELETIHKSVKSTFLPAYCMLTMSGMMTLGTQIQNLIYNPLYQFSNNLTLCNWLNAIVLLLMCVTEIGGYFLWRHRAKRAAEENGEFIKTWGTRTFQLTLLGILAVSLTFTLLSIRPKLAMTMLVSLGAVLGMMFLVVGVKEWMKHRGASRGVNFTVTLLTTILLTLVITGGIGFFLTRETLWLPEEKAVDTYQAYGMTWEVYQDKLPLKVEDLLDPGYDRYSYKLEEESSFLMSRTEGKQEARIQEDAPEVRYTIFDVHFSPLFDFCLEELVTSSDGYYLEDVEGNRYYESYKPADAVPWGADRAYQYHNGIDFQEAYILCYGNRIVDIRFDWYITQEQMAAVGRILGS